MPKKENDNSRDKVLKRMLNTPPETKEDMMERRRNERRRKARKTLENKGKSER